MLRLHSEYFTLFFECLITPSLHNSRNFFWAQILCNWQSCHPLSLDHSSTCRRGSSVFSKFLIFKSFNIIFAFVYACFDGLSRFLRSTFKDGRSQHLGKNSTKKWFLYIEGCKFSKNFIKYKTFSTSRTIF